MSIEVCNLRCSKKVAQQTVAFHWPRPSNFVAHDAAHSPTLHLEDGEYTGTHRPKMKMKGKVGLMEAMILTMLPR